MEYSTPELRSLGSLASLTLGQNGSCPDGPGTNDQVGGGFGGIDDCGKHEDPGNAGGG